MKCQYCSCVDSKVIDSRPTDDGNSIRRRRECINCGRRFTTYEKVEMSPLFVVKRDGRREGFDAQKIKAGILHACDKLPVSMQQIDEMVMAELKELNDVAYVRFAAVYRKFTDVGAFMNELQKLVDEKM